MTSEELRDWQRRCGLRTDADAARVLQVSVGTFRKKINGRAPITGRDEIIAALFRLYAQDWLAIAAAARTIGNLISVIPIPQQDAETIAKAVSPAITQQIKSRK